jgi:hypothetical protein
MYKDNWMPAEWGMPPRDVEVEWRRMKGPDLTHGYSPPFIACWGSFPPGFKHAEFSWRFLHLRLQEAGLMPSTKPPRP